MPPSSMASAGSRLASSLTYPQAGPHIPRRATLNPVAFARTVVSIDSFVASAKDVTFRTSWSFFSANPRCVSGVR